MLRLLALLALACFRHGTAAGAEIERHMKEGAAAVGRGQLSAAQVAFTAALSLAEQDGDSVARGRAHGNLGSLLTRQRDPAEGGDAGAMAERALSHFAEAARSFEDAGDNGRSAMVHFNVGVTLSGLGRHREAIRALQRALSGPDGGEVSALPAQVASRAQGQLAALLASSGPSCPAVAHAPSRRCSGWLSPQP